MEMAYGKVLCAALVSVSLVACSNSDDDNDQEPVTVAFNMEQSQNIPARVYFNNTEVSLKSGYQLDHRRLSITQSSTGHQIYEHTLRHVDHRFPQAELASGEHQVQLEVGYSRIDLPDFNKYSEAELTPSSFVKTYKSKVSKDAETLEYLLELEAEMEAAADCLEGNTCSITDNWCEAETVAVTCQLSDACQQIDLEYLQLFVNANLSAAECDVSVSVDEETPLTLWATAGSGGTGENGSEYSFGGQAGTAGEAVMVTTLGALQDSQSDNEDDTTTLYYALGLAGQSGIYENMGGFGGSSTYLGLGIDMSIENTLVVAGGGGGGSADGSAGISGASGVNRSTEEPAYFMTLDPAGSEVINGGGQNCPLSQACGGDNSGYAGGNSGGDDIGGVGGHPTLIGEAVDADFVALTYWANISEYAEGFGFNLQDNGGWGGSGFTVEVIGGLPSYGGGGGGFGGGASGSELYGGGGAGGSYAGPSDGLASDVVDIDTYEADLQNPFFGDGEVHLIWTIKN